MKKIKVSQLGSVLKGLSELAGDDYTEILQKLSMDAFRDLVMLSAKDTGFLRSNWSVTTGVPDELRLNSNVRAKNSFVKAQWSTVDIQLDSHITLYNNTVYAIYVDQGTPRMRAQPIIEPARRRAEIQAIRLSKLLTKKRYNV